MATEYDHGVAAKKKSRILSEATTEAKAPALEESLFRPDVDKDPFTTFRPLKEFEQLVDGATAWASLHSPNPETEIWRDAVPVLAALVEALKRGDRTFFTAKVNKRLSSYAEAYVLQAKGRQRDMHPTALPPLAPVLFGAPLGNPSDGQIGDLLVHEAHRLTTWADDNRHLRIGLKTIAGRAAYVAKGMCAVVNVSDRLAALRAKVGFAAHTASPEPWAQLQQRLEKALKSILTRSHTGSARDEAIARETLKAIGVRTPNNYLRA